jgi:hypothetical protein
VSAESEPWTRTIGMADMNGTVADVTFEPAADELPAQTSIHLRTGGARLHMSPTPAALRQLAAAMLDGADAMEAEL